MFCLVLFSGAPLWPSIDIKTNVASLNAARHLQEAEAAVNRSIEKLSSGSRIVTAADDAARLAISEKMRAHLSALARASRNVADGISLLQTAEGATQGIEKILVRLRELAVEAAKEALENSDRAPLPTEFAQLIAEIERLTEAAQFNGGELISEPTSIVFQVGGSGDEGENVGSLSRPTPLQLCPVAALLSFRSRCPKRCAPVCGENGRTYLNACVAKEANVSIQHAGICPPRQIPLEHDSAVSQALQNFSARLQELAGRLRNEGPPLLGLPSFLTILDQADDSLQQALIEVVAVTDRIAKESNETLNATPTL